MVSARSAQSSSITQVFLAVFLLSILVAANAHPFIYGSDIQAVPSFNMMPKRSLASGRWGLRPGKRSFGDSEINEYEEASPFAARFPYRYVFVE